MPSFFNFSRVLFLFALVFCICSCGASDNNQRTNAQSDSSEQTIESNTASDATNNLVANPDDEQNTPQISNTLRSWQQIKQSGVIRALKLEWEEETSLPRSGTTSLYHIEVFDQFAKKYDLKVEWVTVKDLNQMLSSLDEYKADVIPRHLTITDKREKLVKFTQPLMQDVEVLVAKKGTKIPKETDGITVSVPASTSYIESVTKNFPNWKIDILDRNLNSEEIAEALEKKQISYSLLDGQSVKVLTSYNKQIKSLMNMPDTKQLAWAVNKNNDSLLDKLNEFIAVHHIAQTSRQNRNLDFKSIKEKNLTLRMITRNSPETYFLWRGELMGFEYELMKEFAKQHKIRLEVIVADNYQQMKDLLQNGNGDIIAAGLSRIDERKSEFKFSYRYNRVSELLVANKNSKPIEQLADLRGRKITVRKSSAFWTTAKNLEDKYGVEVIPADENDPTEILIAQVADNKIDLTIADSNLVSIELRFRNNIITPLTLKENVPYAYAVRENNLQLLGAINAFIKKEYRGTFYNVLKGKYFASKKRLTRYREDRVTSDSTLSPYDQLVKDNARQYQFDWRLITSQMFQESRFNPKASSPAGAKGLMQVLPRTAKELGFFDLENPEQSVAAGVQYLDWTRARFSNNIPLEEKLFFALAAYNAGFGHVRDAQKLAKKMNLRSDKWFDNVEKAMLLLQQPKYYKNTRFGYCRGSEPVNYVREIQQRYLSYVDITH